MLFQGGPTEEDATHRIFLSSVCYYSSYTWSKIDEKISVTDENIFRVCKAFDRKNNSHTDLRTSHAQLSEEFCQYREEDSESKILL